jgi:hypothetical protein
MLGSVLVVSEIALLPVITNSNQLTLMLPACEVRVAHPIFCATILPVGPPAIVAGVLNTAVQVPTHTYCIHESQHDASHRD